MNIYIATNKNRGWGLLSRSYLHWVKPILCKSWNTFGVLSILFLFSLPIKANNAALEKENIELSGIVIVDAYMPQVPPVSNTAAIYLKIENRLPVKVRLTNLETPAARHLMMHESAEVNGIAKMKHVRFIDIEAGNMVHFKPGGLHIMMMGLERDKIGDSFPLTLAIDGEKYEVSVKVVAQLED